MSGRVKLVGLCSGLESLWSSAPYMFYVAKTHVEDMYTASHQESPRKIEHFSNAQHTHA